MPFSLDGSAKKGSTAGKGRLTSPLSSGLRWHGFTDLVLLAIKELDVELARNEVAPFAKNPEALEVWTREFYQEQVRLHAQY
jgi:hypothetical protein